MSGACRALRPADVPQLLTLLRQVRPSIAGVASEPMYRALLREALRGGDLFCVVASDRDKVLGYVLAARNWQRFKRNFLLRHPLLALRILGQRLFTQRRQSPQPSSLATVAVDRTGPQWEQSSPTIAKVLHIGVDPDARGGGVGKALYLFLASYLEPRGIQRIDACVEADNLASLRLHERVGWTVRKDPGHYYAYYFIGGEVNDTVASEACSR
jgi:ribosomal protein S18 acetylase RimI-like enzyme